MEKILVKKVFDDLREDRDKGLASLYNNCHTILLGIAFKYTKSKTISEEIVQDLYLKILKLDNDSFPVKGELSWLYVVTKNQALNFIKRENKYIGSEGLDYLIELKTAEDRVDEDFYDMISDLNEVQKEIVSLKIVSGLTHREISVIVDKPIRTVQWIYNTSIKKLRVAFMTAFIIAFSLIVGGTMKIGVSYALYIKKPPRLDGAEGMKIIIGFLDYVWNDSGIYLIIVGLLLALTSLLAFRNSTIIPILRKKTQ